MRRVYIALTTVAVLSAAALAADAFSYKLVAEKPATPVENALPDLRSALAEAGGSKAKLMADITVEVLDMSQGMRGVPSAIADEMPAPDESFIIRVAFGRRSKIFVVGRDTVGTMYGVFDLAEQIRMAPEQGALAEAIDCRKSQPFIAFRGPNPFLTPQGFLDPDSWYFSEDFWKTYLDMMARARFNWLDLHAGYDIESTGFPNVYTYLHKSEQFPEVGLTPEEAARNLAAFNDICRWAHERGIKVALMSYTACWNGRGLPNPSYEVTAEAMGAYHEEVVEKTLRHCPDLDMIGFRIGESGRAENFFRKSYVDGIANSGRDIPLYTRSWLATRDEVMKIFEAYPGRSFIEIKYNGEHLGMPYIIAGGRMAGWHSYSYQQYSNYPRNYDIIWQIRACGTHRLFSWGDSNFVRRCARNIPHVEAYGFCLEPINCYYPQNNYAFQDDYKYFTWWHQRDWYWNMIWGRLTYDPDTPDAVFEKAFAEKFGPENGPIVKEAMESLSKIVPMVYSSHCLSPDHRGHAPEFEYGGNIDRWRSHPPLDTSQFCTANEAVTTELAGEASHRVTPLVAADMLLAAAEKSTSVIKRANPDGPHGDEIRALAMDARSLAALGRYWAHKHRAATFFEMSAQTGALAEALMARREMIESAEQWATLCGVTGEYLNPVIDTLRMHTMEFTWEMELPKVEADVEIVERYVEELSARVPEEPDIGHYPIRKADPGKPTVVRASVACAHNTRALLYYTWTSEYAAGTQATKTDRVDLKPSREYPGTLEATIPQEGLGTISYYITADSGVSSARLPEAEDATFVIDVTTDNTPPQIRTVRPRHVGTEPTAAVYADVTDDSGVAGAWLWYKGLPSAGGVTEGVKMTFEIGAPATVYVAFDRRSKSMKWMDKAGFEKTEMQVGTTDESLGHYELYGKDMPAGKVELGPNGDAPSMYLVIVQPKQPAETVRVSKVNPKRYVAQAVEPGDAHYIDRDYRVTSAPEELAKATWIRTANDDKRGLATGPVTNWNRTAMDKRGSLYMAVIPATFQGEQIFVEAHDIHGNASAYPDWRVEAPYIVIPGWPEK